MISLHGGGHQLTEWFFTANADFQLNCTRNRSEPSEIQYTQTASGTSVNVAVSGMAKRGELLKSDPAGGRKGGATESVASPRREDTSEFYQET